MRQGSNPYPLMLHLRRGHAADPIFVLLLGSKDFGQKVFQSSLLLNLVKSDLRGLAWNSLVITPWVHRQDRSIERSSCDNWYGWMDGYHQGSINLIT